MKVRFAVGCLLLKVKCCEDRAGFLGRMKVYITFVARSTEVLCCFSHASASFDMESLFLNWAVKQPV